MIDGLTTLLNALAQLNINQYTIALAVIILVGVFVVKYFDDRKFNNYYQSMLKEKNKEIEQLADDNRRYREVYLTKLGVNQEDIKNLSASS